MVPVEDVDVVIPLKPDECARCQQPLLGNDVNPQRHQVIEIPPIRPVVTEYQAHQLVCPICGDVTRAAWPDGVTGRAYGPRVQATAALCTGAYRLSKRTTQQLLDDLFGVPMSLGTISTLEAATAQAVAEFLGGHPRVARVNYPGSDAQDDPEVARRQMRGFGGMVCVDVGGGYERAARFFDRLRVIKRAASLGGVESLCSRAPRARKRG